MKRLLKLTSLLLIQFFLLMDIALAGGSNLFASEKATLAPQVNITNGQFQQIYSDIFLKDKGKDRNSALVQVMPERGRELLFRIEDIFRKNNIGFERFEKVLNAAQEAFIASQQGLEEEKKIRYHNALHGMEVALIVAEALEKEGIKSENDKAVFELVLIAALIHDSGYWQKEWWMYAKEHEELSKCFLETSPGLKGLFTLKQKNIINGFIEYTKFFNEENTPENIEKRIGFKGKFKLAAQILSIADTLSVYGKKDWMEKAKGLYAELQVRGVAKDRRLDTLGSFYEGLYPFIAESIEPRYHAFPKAYNRPYFKAYRNNLEHNKVNLLAFAQAYKFYRSDDSKVVLYPGYFGKVTESNLDVIRKSFKIFGRVLVVTLADSEENPVEAVINDLEELLPAKVLSILRQSGIRLPVKTLDDKYKALKSGLSKAFPSQEMVEVVALNDPALVRELAKICDTKIMIRQFRRATRKKLEAEAQTSRENFEKYGLETYFVLPANEDVVIEPNVLALYQEQFAKILGILEEKIDITSPEFVELINEYNLRRNAPLDLPVNGDTVLYAGSFDPITNGHMEVLGRLAKDFKKVYVGVGINPAKETLFSQQERVKMISEAVSQRGITNVEVLAYEGHTVDCARRTGAGVLVRGARSVEDLDAELPLKYVNEILDPGISTLLVVPYKFSYVSSRKAKLEFLKGKDISGLVPENIRQKLDQNMLILKPDENMRIEDCIKSLKNDLGELKGKTILIKVPASAASFQAIYLISRLVKEGANVRVIIAPDTLHYVKETTLRSISRNPVLDEKEIAKQGDLIRDARALVVLNSSQQLLDDLEPEIKGRLSLLRDKKVIVGISGGIAAYKSIELVLRMKDAGVKVRVALTENALKFIGMDCFKSMGVEVLDDEFKPGNEWQAPHISWGHWADLIILAPATANTIAKVNQGIADNFLTTMLLSTKAPVLIAPAMESMMYEKTRPVIDNLKSRRNQQFYLIGPETGRLASGQEGLGRMSEVSQIIERAALIVSERSGSFSEELKADGRDKKADSLIDMIPDLSAGNGFDYCPIVVLLKKVNGKYYVLLTKRTDEVEYGGMWVFPGGHMKNGETIFQAGARELREETNIRIVRDHALNILAPALTKDKRKRIYPVVAQAPDNFEYKPDRREVADEEWVALEDFFKKETVIERDGVQETIELGPANKKISKDLRYLICKALARQIYGKELIENEMKLVSDIFVLLKQKPHLVSEIIGYLEEAKDLKGMTVVVTAGPNREKLPDMDEYITNPSTGKQGYEIARAASQRGARVILVSGPSDLETPIGVEKIEVTTARQMREAVINVIDEADIYISAAAIADFKPEKITAETDDLFLIDLEGNPDILQEVGRIKRDRMRNLVVVGFAAETMSGQEIIEEARRKLIKKNLDMICGNDVREKGAGFGVDTNKIVIVGRTGAETVSGSKFNVSQQILDTAARKSVKPRPHIMNAAPGEKMDLIGRVVGIIDGFKEQKEDPATKMWGLQGKKIIITAGSTREFFDSVRFISRKADTRLALLLAKLAVEAQAEVIFISTADIRPPQGARHVKIVSAEDMDRVINQDIESADVFINLAEVPLLTPAKTEDKKIKKEDKDRIVWSVKKNINVSESRKIKDGCLVLLPDYFRALEGSNEEIAKETLIKIRNNTQWYLSASLLTDSDNPEVIRTALELTKNAKSDKAKVARILNYLRKIPYAFDLWSTKASETLIKGKGMCGNKMNLAVAMCRCLGIPARLKQIMIERADLKNSVLQAYYNRVFPFTRHCVMEVFVDGKWRDTDVGVALLKKERFKGMQDEIYFSMDEIVEARRKAGIGLGDDKTFHYLNDLYLERLTSGESAKYLPQQAKVIGIAGLTGNGKSTVAGIVEIFGLDSVAVISMDHIGEKVRDEADIKRKLVEAFGDYIIAEDGSIDRQRLGDIVFYNEKEREKLNGIMYPRMRELALKEIEEAKQADKRYVCIEAAVIKELGLDHLCDELWIVESEEEAKIPRLENFRGLKKAKVKAIEARQKKIIDELKQMPGVRIIKNNNSIQELMSTVEEILKDISRENNAPISAFNQQTQEADVVIEKISLFENSLGGIQNELLVEQAI